MSRSPSAPLMHRETSTLLDALGDFILCLSRENQQRGVRNRIKKTPPNEGETKAREVKRTVLEWIRGLGDGEWASLCSVVDVGFVKTVLAMGMAAKVARDRHRRGCTLGGQKWGTVTEFQLIPAAPTAHQHKQGKDDQPREFLRRPLVRTTDGETLHAFHLRTFTEACDAVVRSVRVFNTEKSCDSLAIEMSSRTEWVRYADVISGGRFLLHQRRDHELKSNPLWLEMKWFQERGYFALAELLVNQIEVNIWFHFTQYSRSPSSYKVPAIGIAVKELLAQEWRLASASLRNDAIRCIASQVQTYLKEIPPPMARLASLTTNQQLVTVTQLIAKWKEIPAGRITCGLGIAYYLFSQSLEQTLFSPQGAAVQFLVAELLQDQCAQILTDNLSRPLLDDPSGEGPAAKSTHAQRRRAARKKAAKQRKQATETRMEHERLLHVVLSELPRAVRSRNDQITATVREVLDQLVCAVEGQGIENGWYQRDLPTRTKRRKKRGKKTNRQKNDVAEGVQLSDATQDEKENVLQNAGTVNQSIIVRNETSRPILNFLATKTEAANGYASPRTAAFSTNSFYTVASPFYLQLSHRETSGHGRNEEVEDDDDVICGSAGVNEVATSQRSLVESTFDWYLPSLFSSQSSVHTTSTASSLDWDFQRWNLKTESAAASSKKPVVFGPHLQSPRQTPPEAQPRQVSPPQSPEAGSSAGLRATGRSASYRAQSFSSFVDINSNSESSPENELEEDDAASSPGSDGKCTSRIRSDFLYQEGGFFDRQRGSKRRHRPFPFEYDDEDDSGETIDGRAWEDRLGGANADTSTDERPIVVSKPESPCAYTATHAAKDDEVAKANEQITRLESLLEERLSAFKTESSAMSSEIAGLQQHVSILTKRVKSLEEEIEELHQRGSRPSPNPKELQCENIPNLPPSAPLPASSPSTLVANSAQGYPHPIMRPGGAPNYSILGPFVSVPMSVLPPRSKLHWDMCEYVSHLQSDANARMTAQMAAIRLCTGAVQSLWPRAQVRPYGSFVTRLALPTSDVDLVICLPKVRRDAPADAAGVLEGRNAIKESWQQNLARKLRQEPWVVTDSVKTIPHAAIPIITLITTLPFNVRLDISFEGPGHNGLATNDVVLSLMQEFPPLAPIMLVLKSFVIERGFAVAYSGGLSSYALLLMVARYLQEHTDRYDNADPTSTSSSCADFGMVLMGLLDFFGNRFDPRTTGISVAARCFFNRDSISPPHHQGHLPSSMMHSSVDDAHSDHWQHMNQSSHVHNNANLLSSPGSRRHSNRSSIHDWPMQRADAIHEYSSIAAHDPHKFDPLFIEDPLHLSNNVGRNCFRITQIRRTFATGYTTLMAASMSVSVFSANRNTPVGGVALHPDNILRAILGPNAPAVNSNTTSTGRPETPHQAYQPPKPRVPSHYHRPASSGTAAMRYPTGTPIPMYENPYAHAPFPVPYQTGAASNSNTAPPPPYMLHRMQLQHQQQHFEMYAASVAKSTPRQMDLSAPVYRRHSGSVTEQMTTRSEAAASSSSSAVGKPYSKRAKQHERALDYSPRLMPPTMHRSSSIELDKKASNGSHTATDGRINGRGTTRKIPSRSMSFADVVISGAGSATAAKPDRPRKAPSSPLALVRPAKTRRHHDAAAHDELFNERLETKDDFMI